MPRGWESALRLVEEYNAGRRIRRAERWDPNRDRDPNGSGWSISTIGPGDAGGGLYSPSVDSPGIDEIRGRAMEWLSADNKWPGRSGSSEDRAMDDGRAMMIDTPTSMSSSLEVSHVWSDR